MADRPVLFSRPFAQRVDATVGVVLGAPNNNATAGSKPRIDRRRFWALIGSYVLLTGATNRWQYAWTEQRRTTTGWSTLTGGRSGTMTVLFALNSIEASNDGDAMEGNSVSRDSSSYPAGFSLQPVQGSPVVEMVEESDLDTGELFYSFAYVNSEDGSCEAPS